MLRLKTAALNLKNYISPHVKHLRWKHLWLIEKLISHGDTRAPINYIIYSNNASYTGGHIIIIMAKSSHMSMSENMMLVSISSIK